MVFTFGPASGRLLPNFRPRPQKQHASLQRRLRRIPKMSDKVAIQDLTPRTRDPTDPMPDPPLPSLEWSNRGKAFARRRDWAKVTAIAQ